MTPERRKTRTAFVFVLISAVAAGGAVGCAADPDSDSGSSSTTEEALVAGVLDTSFGANGFASVTFEGGGLTPGGANASGKVTTVLPRPDGSIIAVGMSGAFNSDEMSILAVTKLTPRGTLDPTFGSAGIFRKVIGNVEPDGSLRPTYRYPAVTAAKLDAMGRIVVLRADRSLIRLLPNGTVDASFGVQGVLDPPVPAQTRKPSAPTTARGLVVLPTGEIVISYGCVAPGSMSTGATSFALTRLKSDGTLDTSFGGGGHSLVTLSQSINDSHFDTGPLLRQPDGRLILTAFNSWGGLQGKRMIIARFAANGALDPSFGDAGVTRGSVLPAEAATLDAAGRILVASIRERDTELRRFTSNGKLDDSFGVQGKVIVSFGSSPRSEVRAIHVEETGTILVGGSVVPQGITRTNDPRLEPTPATSDAWQFAIARLTASGAPISTFGTGGVSIAPPQGNVGERAFGMAFDTSGRALLGGYVTTVTEFRWGRGGTGLWWKPTFAVARFK